MYHAPNIAVETKTPVSLTQRVFISP